MDVAGHVCVGGNHAFNPAHTPHSPARNSRPPVRGVTPGSQSPATESAPRTRPDVPDAAEAEPVPHEHLPSRSDDN
jgi:hypothetical protein